jgi:predicted dehydrogenase
MPNRLRWGLLGVARINRTIIPTIRALPRHELVGVASRDAARASAHAAEWGIPVACGSYEALLARDDIDVVYVALPNTVHAEWTVRAADAGKHVLCEKPLATRVADVDAMIAAARRNGVCVSEGFMYRHHPQTMRVRELVASGELGELRVVRGAFTFPLQRPADIRWNAALGGGALWDVGCYPVSYARLIAGGEPHEAVALQTIGAGSVDVSCAGILRFGPPVVAVFDCGFQSAFRASLEIVGTAGVLDVPAPYKPGVNERLILTREGTRTVVDVAGQPPYHGEIEDMAAQILDGRPPGMALADSRANVEALVALHRSANEGRAVALSEVAA